MELYQAIEKRHTIRDFTDQVVPEETLERILEAGLKAPSHDHDRDWHYVVIRDPARIAEVLQAVAGKAAEQLTFVKQWTTATESQRAMYFDAVPKQAKMLMQSRCLVIPLFRAGADLMQPKGVTSLNSFASIWCVIDTILLSATAEGVGCALRIPIFDEEDYVLKTLNAPAGYRMPCYLALGYASHQAPIIKQTLCPLKEHLHHDTW